MFTQQVQVCAQCGLEIPPTPTWMVSGIGKVCARCFIKSVEQCPPDTQVQVQVQVPDGQKRS